MDRPWSSVIFRYANTSRVSQRASHEVKEAVADWIKGQGSLLDQVDGMTPAQLHELGLRAFEQMLSLPVECPDVRADLFYKQVRDEPHLQRLKVAFDTWCALWFWPADRLDLAPMPATWQAPSQATLDIIRQLAGEHRFFHCELEFPDVFTGPNTGFDAVLGNPPWEIQKPNSKEFFSNVDPLYRAYGKQEAVVKQTEYFQRGDSAGQAIERDWLEYSARFKALSNWNKNAAWPFGEPHGEEKAGFNLKGDLHARWQAQRLKRTGYADTAHPFRHQGSSDINTYKMFLETAHALLKSGGLLGLIVPSGVYTDKGSTALRTLFLEKCRWRWLFGFENRDKIFDIHRSFKFCPLIVEKGGKTEVLRAAFMRHDLKDWEDGERHAVSYTREQVLRFSPKTKAILEIRSRRDLEIIEKIYANSVLLGDEGPDGWGIQYAREFDMTNDSKLFPPLPEWEKQGCGYAAPMRCSPPRGMPLGGEMAVLLGRSCGQLLSMNGCVSVASWTHWWRRDMTSNRMN
ncbi:MAG: hypothetical protein ABSE73_13390 [Planctomycetota bacterium]